MMVKRVALQLSESERVGREQVALWRSRGVTLREAAESLGRASFNNWEAAVWAVAAEWTQMNRRRQRALEEANDDGP